MNARETLRTIAAWVTLPAPPEPRAAAEYAAALRALADRMDDELNDAKVGADMGLGHGRYLALARLDSPLGHGQWRRCRKCEAVSPDVRTDCVNCGASLDAPLAPAPVPMVCAEWCGTDEKTSRIGYWRAGKYYCTPACRDAGRPLHPATPGGR
jgi:hypothetical protein